MYKNLLVTKKKSNELKNTYLRPKTHWQCALGPFLWHCYVILLWEGHHVILRKFWTVAVKADSGGREPFRRPLRSSFQRRPLRVTSSIFSFPAFSPIDLVSPFFVFMTSVSYRFVLLRPYDFIPVFLFSRSAPPSVFSPTVLLTCTLFSAYV